MYDSGYANVNGTRLYYEIAGKGVPIVFIHGSFGDRRHWDLQFFEFSKRYRVLRYDLRGFGRSADPDTVTLYRDADDLNALMEDLKIPKANICGLSSGSFVVIDFALSYPKKCISLIPMGPRVAGDEIDEYRTSAADSLRMSVANVLAILKTKGKREAIDSLWLANNVLANSVKSIDTKKRLLQMGYDYSWSRYLYPNKRQYSFSDAIKRLNKIEIPTLIITAEFDVERCKQVAQILADNIPGSKLVSIKDAGHIMNMDKPKKFNNLVSEFIDKIKF